jgi:tetratricopeptide (TPR) repeat protein
MTPKMRRRVEKQRPPSRATLPADESKVESDFVKVRAALITGDFDDDVPASLSRLVEWLQRPTPDLSEKGLKRRSVAAEVLDHNGQWDQARELTDVGKDVLDQLREDIKVTGPTKSMLEMVRLCVNYGRFHFYRGQHFDEATDVITECMKILKDLGPGTCDRTLGQINLYLGRICRERGQYSKADEHFLAALTYFNRRLEAKRFEPHTPRDVKFREELKGARYRSAQCLAGLGLVCYSRGDLKRALSYVVPAYTLFLQTKDALGLAHLDVLRGSIRRSMAGRERVGLSEALKLVSRADDVFHQYGHGHGRAKTAYELAQIHSSLTEGAQAQQYLKKAITLAEKNHDDRWLCHSKNLASRIAVRDRNFALAESLATEALMTSKSRGASFATLQVRALLCRGGARLNLDRMDDALSDFEAAYEMIQASAGHDADNPQLLAVCVLNLARWYAKNKKKPRAMIFFDKWLELKDRVAIQDVHDLAADVKKQVFGPSGLDFVIPNEHPDLNYKGQKRQLQIFLYQQARAATRGQKAAMAKKLGITRQALHTWEQEIGEMVDQMDISRGHSRSRR